LKGRKVISEESRKFNDERLRSIQKNFNTFEISARGKTISALGISRANRELVIDKGEKQEAKNLFDNLLIDVFGTGDLGLIESAFSIFESPSIKYTPDFSFKRDGLDVVKSSILGGNADIFRMACDKVGINNIENKHSALTFATENGMSDIEETLLKLEADRKKEEEGREKTRQKNKAKRDRAKASKAKAAAQNTSAESAIIAPEIPPTEDFLSQNDSTKKEEIVLNDIIAEMTAEEKESRKAVIEECTSKQKTINEFVETIDAETETLINQCLEEFGWTRESENIDEKKLINRLFELTFQSGEDKGIEQKTPAGFFENIGDTKSEFNPNAKAFVPINKKQYEEWGDVKPSGRTSPTSKEQTFVCKDAARNERK
jgi:hypothetical protein